MIAATRGRNDSRRLGRPSRRGCLNESQGQLCSGLLSEYRSRLFETEIMVRIMAQVRPRRGKHSTAVTSIEKVDLEFGRIRDLVRSDENHMICPKNNGEMPHNFVTPHSPGHRYRAVEFALLSHSSWITIVSCPNLREISQNDHLK
jgi:hypothetical protein